MTSPTAEDKMGRAIATVVTVAVVFIIFAGFVFLKVFGLL
jgi:hypothetical protein